MKDVLFREAARDASQEILTVVAPEILPAMLAPDRTLVQVADLPFYEEFKLYAITDLRLPVHNVRYVLYKPGVVALLDGTNEPIYRVNGLAPIRLDRDTAVSYVRFFFQFVSGPMGGFTIVEEPEDLVWLPDATDEERTDVAARLMPLSYKGVDADGLITLTGTVLFQNGLFVTDIQATPREMNVVNPESGATQHLAAGELRFVNEELLVEDLSVPSDLASDEDGGDSDETDESDEEMDGEGDGREIVSSFQPYDQLAVIEGVVFTELASDAAGEILAAIPPEILAATPSVDQTLVQAADLPFYETFKLYALTDRTVPAPNVRFMLYKPGCVVPMNRSNEPIYAINDIEPIKLTADTLAPYLKFFFFLVRGQLGHFIIVEKPEDIAWLPKATARQKAKVAAHLMPLTYNGIDPDGLFTLTGTVIFKNALFRTDMKVAPREMDVPDPESDAPEHFTIGQITLTNEELLVENLRVPLD